MEKEKVYLAIRHCMGGMAMGRPGESTFREERKAGIGHFPRGLPCVKHIRGAYTWLGDGKYWFSSEDGQMQVEVSGC